MTKKDFELLAAALRAAALRAALRAAKAELARVSVEHALGHYRAARREGYNEENARAQAIAYLRRKTHWTFHLAAGTFDAALRDVTITI